MSSSKLPAYTFYIYWYGRRYICGMACGPYEMSTRRNMPVVSTYIHPMCKHRAHNYHIHLVPSTEVRRPHTCSRQTKRKRKSRRTQSTPRNPQWPGDRDHLETACDETRPPRQPVLARFHRSRVGGNPPRTALAIRENHKCYTYRQIGKLNSRTLHAPRYY